MMQMSMTIPKLDSQIKLLLNYPTVWRRHVIGMQQNNARLMKTGWQNVAARRTGLYVSRIMDQVRMVTGEIHAVASTDVRSPRGFPYPLALEESTRYHYRSTGRSGQPTAGKVF